MNAELTTTNKDNKDKFQYSIPCCIESKIIIIFAFFRFGWGTLEMMIRSFRKIQC